ncbi:DEAD/DEAH box helicase family protein [Mycolicibacterium goodii]|uniref:DEAD/DEAH box helicase family protein n=1 Tax=Mycolicibacterium goodii TaxID=134601 RepID=UPI00256F24F8|nr:DEAD/DEAH box helicase family protein [Mycolicibacterium goodii]
MSDTSTPEIPDPDTTAAPAATPSAAKYTDSVAAPSAPRTAATATDFRPGTDIHVPSGAKARIRANIAVIEVLARLREEDRPATVAEQQTLACWSGWGSVPEVFDRRIDTYADERQYLQSLLSPQDYRAAEASVLNAHYTDPAIADTMWQALQQAGFSGGRVLEPGCGSGTFIGLAPDNAVMVGVENDPTTAAVAAALYPSAQIRAEGFETTHVPGGSFVATVGNVPFGQFTVYDPAHNPQRFSIHNHFIIKSLDLTAAGGYVVVLTSRYTLDAIDTKARRAIAQRADLLGAVRLPTKAFRRIAGTDVVTDILVLRRRDPDQPAPRELPSWVHTQPLTLSTGNDLDSAEVCVNAYFHDHPERVMGTFTAGHGMHGSTTLHVVGDDTINLRDAVAGQLASIVTAARQHGYGLTATAESVTEVPQETFDPGLLTISNRPDEDTLRYNPETKSIQRWTGHSWAEHRTPKSLISETRKLIELRDAATAVIASQRDGQPAADREQLRAHLNRLYDAYVSVHGPINRFKWVYPKPPTQEAHDRKVAAAEERWRKQQGSNGQPYRGPVPAELLARWDEAGWATRAPYKRRPHLDGGMKNDPGWANVASLEIFDEQTGKATKAPIFSVDVLTARPPRDHAETISDALAMSLDQRRRVDVSFISELRGISEDDVRQELHGLVYPSLDDPDELIPATTALSGNVRQKLVAATEAAKHNSIYTDYAEALRAVLPPDKEASRIKARPGAPWIAPRYVAQFAREVFGAEKVEADHVNGTWSIECPRLQRATVAMTETWGTATRDAIELLEAVCNSKPIVVERSREDIETHGGDPIDTEATFAAQAKASKISDEFQRWIFAEDARREELVAEFNRRFNSLVAPSHRGDGLALPGLSDRFIPHTYQRNAVARIIAEPSVLLDHVVGAGKTGTMFMAAMELRRLGFVRQPWIVVPNHLVEQFGREAKQWYPAAKVLMGTAATDPDGRRRLVAQSAVSDWDMVIVPQSLFTAIGVSDDVKASYIEGQLDALKDQRGQAVTQLSKKRLELAEKKLKARLEELTAQQRKDTGLLFEQTGCDYLFIDEAHLYKNKGRVSNIEELSCASASVRAEDLAMKIDLLRQRRFDEGLAAGLRPSQIVERVATFATGTPIANSLGELWVMQNYLRPDLLEAAGVADINDWGATFTTTVNTVEVNATGTSLRPVTRVGRFCNLQELQAISAIFTDVVTREDVPIELPEIVDGQRKVVSIAPSQEVKDFIADLGWRSSNIDTKRLQVDNILKIANDGRAVSLDPRLAHLDKPAVSRASVVADEIMRIHHATADNVYLDPETGLEMPIRGGLQIAFCDRGTPSADAHAFTLYAALRDELVERGMPATKIRFIHDAVKAEDKARLARDCIHGEVSVLVGSTEKMGTGTNVQARATAEHHIDVPWRPADLEQREGRIIRQGNQNREIEIITYVTEGSYDAVMWQKVESKSAFIEQYRRGNVTVDEIEDISGGDLTNAAAETKAIATGDPRFIRQVKLDDEVKRLQALQTAHGEAAARRQYQLRQCRKEIEVIDAELSVLESMMPVITDNLDRPATLTVGDTTYDERKTAAPPFADACRQTFHELRNSASWDQRPVGAKINGIAITARRDHLKDRLILSLDIPSAETAIDRDELMSTTPTLTLNDNAVAAKARGLLQRVENIYKDLPVYQSRLSQRRSRLQAEVEDLTATELGEFEHADELAAKREELSALTAQLRLEAQSQAAQTAATEAAQRLRAAGRQPGWSLHLNPTPALVQESGLPDADSYRAAQRFAEQRRAAEYRREQQHGQHQSREEPGLSQ